MTHEFLKAVISTTITAWTLELMKNDLVTHEAIRFLAEKSSDFTSELAGKFPSDGRHV